MGAYSSWVAGIEHRPKAARQKIARARPTAELAMRREPMNPHDPNAVALWYDGCQIGYVPARHSGWVADRIDRGAFVAIYIAEITTKTEWFSKTAAAVDTVIVTSIWEAPEGSAAAAEAVRRIAEKESDDARREEEEAAERQLQPIVSHAVALLRWVAKADGSPRSDEEDIVDACVEAIVIAFGKHLSAERMARLRRPSAGLKGSKARAMTAIDALVADRTAIVFVTKALLDLVKADGVISDEERQIVRLFMERARQAAARA